MVVVSQASAAALVPNARAGLPGDCDARAFVVRRAR